MTECWFCGSRMMWERDYSFEDYSIEGEGTVANLTCIKCGATAEFYTKINENEEINDGNK